MTISILKNKYIVLTLIFLFALVLRVYNLGVVPQSFHTDELAAGYIGRYIFLHGQDIYGNAFPLFFDKFGDFRPIGIFWLSGIFTFIFGVNEFATRLPSSLFGALTVFPLYLLLIELFKKPKVALVASFFLAILPWHVVLSRSTSEGIIGLFFLIFSLYFGFVYLRTGKIRYLIYAFVLCATTYFFYHVYRLLIPFIFLPLPLFAKANKIKITIAAFITILFAITALLGLTGAGSGRFSQVAFYKNEILNNTIQQFTIGEGQNHIFEARLFHNKAVVYARGFIGQYISYYSFDFLFEDKGLPDRYVVPGQGILYYSFIPLLLLFFFFFLQYQRTNKFAWYLLYLFLLAALPAALTYEDSPNIHRSMLMILPIVIMLSIGSLAFWEELGKRKKLYFTCIMTLFLTLELVFFIHQYSVHSKSYKPFFRNQGEKELIEYVLANQKNYTTIYLPMIDDIPLYYLFYARRFELLPDGLIKSKFKADTIDNLVFIDDPCISNRIMDGTLVLQPNSLIIENGDCSDKKGTTSQTIVTRFDGTKAYRIVNFDKD